jgi:hypothetical protein
MCQPGDGRSIVSIQQIEHRIMLVGTRLVASGKNHEEPVRITINSRLEVMHLGVGYRNRFLRPQVSRKKQES